MTYQPQPPYVPGSTPPNADWQPPAERKSHVLPILLGILALSILGVVGLIIAAALNSGSADVPTAPGVQRAAEPAAVDPVTEDVPAPVYTPKVADFELTAKVTSKECFGSAGCNVEFEPNLGYAGPALDEAVTWRLIYEAHGVEDGPLVGTIEVTGDDYQTDSEFVGT
jgi:hypothetical protein